MSICPLYCHIIRGRVVRDISIFSMVSLFCILKMVIIKFILWVNLYIENPLNIELDIL